jgi:hypothetical protein
MDPLDKKLLDISAIGSISALAHCVFDMLHARSVP